MVGSRVSARLCYAIGVRAKRHELWQLAAFAFSLAARLHPGRAMAWWHYGRMSARLGRESKALAAFERAFDLDPASPDFNASLAAARPRGPIPNRLGFIALGTTGLCNASCIHCPTGKESTAHVPRVPMSMSLFRKIIDEIAALRMPITGQFAFGMFGDALVDPHVVERARYLRSRFPSVPLSINTNGAAFNRERHAPLLELGVIIGLHCESIVAASFDKLMQPLRLDRVIPKYEQILELFGESVIVSVPLGRANIADAAETRAWFEARGGKVMFAPIASRCAEDRSLFDSLAFAPKPMRCSSAVLDDLSIDCDGLVLRCCQDFRRTEPVGNVAEQPLREIIFGASRRRHADLLDGGRHAESPACSNCFADDLYETQALVAMSHR